MADHPAPTDAPAPTEEPRALPPSFYERARSVTRPDTGALAASPPPSPGGDVGDGIVGRFLAFAACQRDDTDRAICDAFYRAFVRLEEQLDATQRRMDAGARAFERVCFARDRFAEQLETTIQRDNIEAQRISTIADEAFGPFPVQTSDENLTAIERGIFGLRQRIGNLEAQRESVADVASEGDVEDLLDALDNLSADPKDGETWGARYQTAGALHDAWQDERSRRALAEQDAERWHRLFDEGATLTQEIKDERDSAFEREADLRAQLAAASDRYARAVADADEVRGRLTERAEKAEAERDLLMKDTGARLDGYRELGAQTAAALNERDQARLGERDALATAARLRAELEGARGKALEEAADEVDRIQWGPDGDCGAAQRIRALAAKGG